MTIRGQLFPHEGGMGKSVFLRAANEDDGSRTERDTMVMCSVEDLALAHYRTLGFDQGLSAHCFQATMISVSSRIFFLYSESIPPRLLSVSLKCVSYLRHSRRRLYIFRSVWTTHVGHHLHGWGSRCLPKPLPGTKQLRSS